MFAEDTNLFFEHKRKHVVFSTVNRDLQNINKCFISNKLSLNVKKRNLKFEHLKLTKNKNAKDTGLRYKAKFYLNKDSLLALYFSYIHFYINYTNLVWGSTHRTYLRNINSQQKHALDQYRTRTDFTIPHNFLSLVKYSMYVN